MIPYFPTPCHVQPSSLKVVKEAITRAMGVLMKIRSMCDEEQFDRLPLKLQVEATLQYAHCLSPAQMMDSTKCGGP